MCPSAPVSPSADIGFHWSHEEVIMSLEKIILGACLPSNVIPEVNPHKFLPWNLPDDVWYFFNPEDPKATDTGYWKTTVKDPRVLTNSSTTGSRSTLEFYIGQAPHGRKTDWAMHEYRINPKGLCEFNKVQDSNSLCRVFLNHGQSSNSGVQHNQAGAQDANGNSNTLNAEENNHNSQDSRSMSQEVNMVDGGTLVAPERHLGDQRLDYPVQDFHEIEGDYLELLDLENPESPSSSSENSSCLTMSSDECFDHLDLLRCLDAGNDQDMLQKHTASKFSVSASVKPNQVVIRPEPSGFLLGNNRSNLSRGGNLAPDFSLQLHDGDVNRGPSKITQRKEASQKEVTSQKKVASQKKAASSSNSVQAAPAAAEGKGKAVAGRMAKLRKKYCCFMPF